MQNTSSCLAHLSHTVLLAFHRASSAKTTSSLTNAAQVFEVGPQQHVLLSTMHHSLTDGWSAGLLQRELAAAYTAVVQGGAPAWSPLPVQVNPPPPPPPGAHLTGHIA